MVPDIAMCANHNCPARAVCYRYRAIPNELRQSWMEFAPEPGKPRCDHLVPIEGWPLAPLPDVPQNQAKIRATLTFATATVDDLRKFWEEHGFVVEDHPFGAEKETEDGTLIRFRAFNDETWVWTQQVYVCFHHTSTLGEALRRLNQMATAFGGWATEAQASE